MNKIIGGLVIALGTLLALFVGVYLCLFCGILDVIEACKADPVPAGKLAWGILRIIPLAELSGAVIFWFSVGFGGFLIAKR